MDRKIRGGDDANKVSIEAASQASKEAPHGTAEDLKLHRADANGFR